MNKFKKLGLFALSLFLCLLTSCKDDDFSQGSIVVEEGKTVVFESYCDQYPVNISAKDEDWKIETEDTWITPMQLTGRGTTKVFFYVEENNEVEDRSSIIHFVPTNGDAPTVITVTQKGLGSNENNDSKGPQKKYGVGWGYNGYGDYGNDKYLTNQILNEKLACDLMDRYAPGNAGIVMEDYEIIDAFESVGISSTELSTKLAVNANLKLDIPCGFSMGLKANYSGDDLSNESKNFTMKRYKSVIERKYADVPNLMAIAGEDSRLPQATKDSLFSSGFLNGLAKLKAENYSSTTLKEFVDAFGTHLVVSADIGGRFDYTMTTDKKNVSSDMDIKASLDMGFKTMFSIHGDAEYDKSAKQVGDNYSCKVTVKGGKASILAGAATGSIKVSGCSTEDIKSWTNSITDRNALMVDFQLVPIWEIIPNKESSERIKAYIMGTNYMSTNPDFQLPVPRSDASVASIIKVSDVKSILGGQGAREVKTLVCSAVSGNKTIVEFCEEIIKPLGNKRVLIAYPVIQNHPDYSKGLFLGDGESAPGYITWENEQYTYKKTETYKEGDIIDEVYAHSSGPDILLSGTKPSSTATWKIAAVSGSYARYYKMLNSNGIVDESTIANPIRFDAYSIVKIGQHVWTREDISSVYGLAYNRMDFGFRKPNSFYYAWSDKFINIQWTIPTTQCFKELQSISPTSETFLAGGKDVGLRKEGASGLNLHILGYLKRSGNEGEHKEVKYIYLRAIGFINEGKIVDNNTAIRVSADGLGIIEQVPTSDDSYYPVRLVRTNNFEYQ